MLPETLGEEGKRPASHPWVQKGWCTNSGGHSGACPGLALRHAEVRSQLPAAPGALTMWLLGTWANSARLERDTDHSCTGQEERTCQTARFHTPHPAACPQVRAPGWCWGGVGSCRAGQRGRKLLRSPHPEPPSHPHFPSCSNALLLLTASSYWVTRPEQGPVQFPTLTVWSRSTRTLRY